MRDTTTAICPGLLAGCLCRSAAEGVAEEVLQVGVEELGFRVSALREFQA